MSVSKETSFKKIYPAIIIKESEPERSDVTLQNAITAIPAQLTTTFLLLAGVIFCAAVYSAYLVGGYCSKRWDGNDIKTKTVAMLIMGGVSLLSLILFGISMATFQAIILCNIYLFASYSDFKTRELDDSTHCLLIATSLIGCSLVDIPDMLFAGIAVGGVMLLVAVISGGKGVGGADIKLGAASAFLLGAQRGLVGVIVGLLIGVVYNAIQNKRKGTKEGFPLVPYLAIGFMAAFFI